MNLQDAITTLRRNLGTFRCLVADLDEGRVRWRPDPDAWSILEVVNHLADEEKEDFRRRLDLLWNRPRTTWPSIDPEGWVHERRYAERDFGDSLKAFEEARQQSLEWLQTLSNPSWDASYEHPKMGTLRAGDLLASWMAHDLLHQRQIVRIQYAYLAHHVRPYEARYAGPW